jgi:hypothetical protein
MAETQSAQTISYSRAPFSTWLAIVCVFVLFGLIVLAVIGPSPRRSDYEEARAKKRIEKLKALNEENQKELTTYAWLDKNKGVARIPIDRAMEITVADLAQKKPATAGPIATPATQAAPAAAPAAPAASQQPGTAQPPQPSAPAGSPAGASPAAPQGAAVASSPAEAAAKAGAPSAIAGSPSPASQQSPQTPASPPPASTP